MSARSFVVARGEGRDREYFVRTAPNKLVLTSPMIINAMRFSTKAVAKAVAVFLAENDLTGFGPSEISSGTSRNIAGEQA